VFSLLAVELCDFFDEAPPSEKRSDGEQGGFEEACLCGLIGVEIAGS